MKHKHYNLIIAWANGAEIERYQNGKWEKVTLPMWIDSTEYRIKPEHKPDVVLYACAEYCEKDGSNGVLSIALDLSFYNENFESKPNIKLLYDGETKELKYVEKI